MCVSEVGATEVAWKGPWQRLSVELVPESIVHPARIQAGTRLGIASGQKDLVVEQNVARAGFIQGPVRRPWARRVEERRQTGVVQIESAW